jgi:hypothetical protein
MIVDKNNENLLLLWWWWWSFASLKGQYEKAAKTPKTQDPNTNKEPR